jgi:aspartate kinase
MTTLSITAFDMCGTSGFLSKVFAPFEKFGISVDLIATSQVRQSIHLSIKWKEQIYLEYRANWII